MRSHEFERRGGAHSFEELEAEALGKNAAEAGQARTSNPHPKGSALFQHWDKGHTKILPPAEEPAPEPRDVSVAVGEASDDESGN